MGGLHRSLQRGGRGRVGATEEIVKCTNGRQVVVGMDDRTRTRGHAFGRCAQIHIGAYDGTTVQTSSSGAPARDP